jgi:hypothetical protein
MRNLSVRKNDTRVESWCELCERLYENSWQDNLMRYRSDYAFRGLSNASYGLETSFMRRCGSQPHLEYHLLRSFSKYAEVLWTGGWQIIPISMGELSFRRN